MLEQATLIDQINEAAAYLKKQIPFTPQTGIILGTGLGGFAKEIENPIKIAYADIPHFPQSTVQSHAGDLIAGTLRGKPIIAFQGRFHFYEGYHLNQVTFPVRIVKALGAQNLVVSNAAGGMNPLYKAGDLVIIVDHINFMGVNPLVGMNYDELGPRFPDMSEPYCRAYADLAEKVALKHGIKVHKGVYIGVSGPCLETAAEYRMMRQWGADVVGMSTVPEVIVAVHAGLKVFGLSCVTDMCLPDALEAADVNKIIATAEKAEPHLNTIIQGVVEHI